MMHSMDLRYWRGWLGLTQAAAGLELGIGERQYKRMEAGVVPIPRYIEMACVALQLGVRRYASQVYSHLDDPVMPLDWLRGFAISLTKGELKILSRVLSGRGVRVPADHAKVLRYSGRLMRLELITAIDDPETGKPYLAPTERGQQMHAIMVNPKLKPERDLVAKGRPPSNGRLD
jgi:hypothetical protein